MAQRVVYVTPEGIPCDEYGRILPGAEKQRIPIPPTAAQIQGAPLPADAAGGGGGDKNGAGDKGRGGGDMQFVPKKDKEKPAAGGGGGGGPKWECPSCTYVNDGSLKSCAICQAKRAAGPGAGGADKKDNKQPQPTPPGNAFAYPSLNQRNGGGYDPAVGNGNGMPPAEVPRPSATVPRLSQPPNDRDAAAAAAAADPSFNPAAKPEYGQPWAGGPPPMPALPPNIAGVQSQPQPQPRASKPDVPVPPPGATPVGSTPSGELIYLDANGNLIRVPPPARDVPAPVPAPAPKAAVQPPIDLSPAVPAAAPVPAPAPAAQPSPPAAVAGGAARGLGLRMASDKNLLAAGAAPTPGAPKLACGAAPLCDWTGSTGKARAEHEAQCLHMPVQCVYAEFGCDEHHTREDMKSHCRDGAGLHLDMVVARVRSLEKSVQTLTRAVSVLRTPAVVNFLEELASGPASGRPKASAAAVRARLNKSQARSRTAAAAFDGDDDDTANGDDDNTTNPHRARNAAAGESDGDEPAPVPVKRNARSAAPPAAAPAAGPRNGKPLSRVQSKGGEASYAAAAAGADAADVSVGPKGPAVPAAAPAAAAPPALHAYEPLYSSVAQSIAAVLPPAPVTPSAAPGAKRSEGEGEAAAGAVMITPIVARSPVVDAPAGDVKSPPSGAAGKDQKSAGAAGAGAGDRNGCSIAHSFTFSAGGAQDGHIQQVCALAVSGDEVFACDTQNSRVSVFSRADGRYVRKFGDGVLAGPTGMVVDETDAGAEVFVSDQLNNRIAVFSRDDGRLLRQWGFNAKRARGANDDGGEGAGKDDDADADGGDVSRGPCDVAVYGDECFATDWDAGCVRVFNKRTGKLTRTFGDDRLRAEELSRLSIDAAAGEVLVAGGDDSDDAQAVLVFRASDGVFVRALPKAAGKETRDPPSSGLSRLSGSDELWMACGGNALVSANAQTGAVLRKITGTRTKWSTPTAFAFDLAPAPAGSQAAPADVLSVGRVFVAGELHRIYCYFLAKAK